MVVVSFVSNRSPSASRMVIGTSSPYILVFPVRVFRRHVPSERDETPVAARADANGYAPLLLGHLPPEGGVRAFLGVGGSAGDCQLDLARGKTLLEFLFLGLALEALSMARRTKERLVIAYPIGVVLRR